MEFNRFEVFIAEVLVVVLVMSFVYLILGFEPC